MFGLLSYRHWQKITKRSLCSFTLIWDVVAHKMLNSRTLYWCTLILTFFSAYNTFKIVSETFCITVISTQSCVSHRVYRVPGFYPVVLIGSPHPLSRRRVLLPLTFGSKGETHSLGGGGGRPNSDDGTDTRYTIIPKWFYCTFLMLHMYIWIIYDRYFSLGAAYIT